MQGNKKALVLGASFALGVLCNAAFGIGLQTPKNNSVAVVNDAGQTLVTFTGLHIRYASREIFSPASISPIEGGYEVVYKAPDTFPTNYTMPRVTGQFIRKDNAISVSYRLAGIATNDPFKAQLCMIGRRYKKGTSLVDVKNAPTLGYWVRDPNGGQPWEEALGKVVAYTNDVSGLKYVYTAGQGARQDWQDGSYAHLRFEKDAAGDWVGGFSVVELNDPRSDLAITMAVAGLPVAVSLSSPRVYNWFDETFSRLSYTIRITNCSAKENTLRLSHITHSYDGAVVESAEQKITLKSGEAQEVPVAFDVKTERGIYFVEASVSDAEGKELAFSRTNLVKLPSHTFKSTPETSVFGLSAYWPIPDEESVQRLMDRMGVRWIRNGDTKLQHPPRVANHHSNWKKQLEGEAREKWIIDQLEKCRAKGNRYWEFGNELNMQTLGIGMSGGGIGKAFAAPLYAEWVKEIVRIRAERGFEDVCLLGLGVAGFDKAFFNKMQELGLWELLDGFSLHPGRGNFVVEYPYLEPEDWKGAAKEIENPANKRSLAHSNYWNFLWSVRGCMEFIAKNGEKPLWLTEIYAPTNPNSWWEDTIRNAADNTFLMYCFIKADGVKCGMFYQLFDTVWYNRLGIKPKDREFFFGLVNRDLSFKPSLMAYCAVAEFLDEAQFDGWFTCPQPTTHAMRFKTPKGTAAVLWDRSEGLFLNADHGKGRYRSPEAWENRWKKSVLVSFKANGPVTVTDAIGRKRTLKPKNGIIEVKATGAIQVIEGRDLELVSKGE